MSGVSRDIRRLPFYLAFDSLHQKCAKWIFKNLWCLRAKDKSRHMHRRNKHISGMLLCFLFIYSMENKRQMMSSSGLCWPWPLMHSSNYDTIAHAVVSAFFPIFCMIICAASAAASVAVLLHTIRRGVNLMGINFYIITPHAALAHKQPFSIRDNMVIVEL